MKKQLTTLVIAGLVASTAAFAQHEAVIVRDNGVLKDRWGECVWTLDGSTTCSCEDIIVSLNTDAFFDFDKSTIKPAGKKVLDKLIADARGAESIEEINLAGYTDSIGTEAYNIGLSERRADAVKAYLVSKGVPSSVITTVGYGEADPIATNETAEGRALNRRVDTVIKLKENACEKLISLDADAFFDFDKATIKPAGEVVLDKLVAEMKGSRVESINLAGYTDSIGNPAYNLRLSEHRANAVKDYLVSKGISSNLITTVGYGAANPVASNQTPEGRALNRRVDVRINEVK